MNSFIVLMLHEVPEAEVQDWVFAVAKEIVELHNGTITAKSENEQIEFTVTLPLL